MLVTGYMGWPIDQRHEIFGGELKNLYESCRNAISLLDKQSRLKYFILSGFQVLLSALDIAAVALVGFVTVLLLNFDQPANPIFDGLQSTLGLTKNQISSTLLLLAVVLFSLRTWLAVKLIKSALLFLGKRSAAYSSMIFGKILDRPTVALSPSTLASKQYALVTGSNSSILGILGGLSGLVSDVSVTLGLFVFFLFASPVVAVAAAGIGVVFLGVLIKQTAGRGAELSRTIAETEIQTRTIISNSISRYRETFVAGKLNHLKLQFNDSRKVGVEATAHWTFLPNVGKYVLEAGIIIGGLLLGLVLFAFENPQNATAILSMFLAASTRLAPAMIRIQQGIVSIKGHISQKQELDALTIEISETKQVVIDDDLGVDSPNTSLRQGVSVAVSNVVYRHDEHTPLIENWSIEVPSGSFVTLIGKSGSGKSSLADLILGLIEPSSGSVSLDNQSPAHFILTNRGSVGYVPQYSSLTEGTIRSNLLIGHNQSSFSDKELFSVLEACSIDELATSQELGLDSVISEQGRNLSGGQRQRLSLAQALLAKPRFLILDEATASLDKANEMSVMVGIRKYLPTSTILAITHSSNLTEASDQVFEIRNRTISNVKNAT
jgi:ABC-type multidrug transport system fused ATPase/permease subunit